MHKCSFILSLFLIFPFFQAFSQKQNLDHDLEGQYIIDKENAPKFYQRWKNHQESRLQTDGNFVAPSTWRQGTLQATRIKNENISARNRGNWSPVGPDIVPPTGSTSLIPGIGRINCMAFHPIDSNIFWVGVAQGGVWKTTNNGQSWIPLTDELPMLRISDIAVNPQNPDILYISVGDYAYLGVGLELDTRKRFTHYGLGVYKSNNGGQTWEATGLTFSQTERDASLMRRVIIHPENTDELVAVGIQGIWRSGDAGKNWQKILDSFMWDIEQDPDNPSILFASSGYRATLDEGEVAVYRSSNFGDSWKKLELGIQAQGEAQRVELAIAPSNPNFIYALSCDGDRFGGFNALHRSIDGGDSWERRSAWKTDSLNILHWSTGMSRGGQGTYDLALTIHPTNENLIYAGGINLWGSEDGGETWNIASYWLGFYGPSIHADQHQFRFGPIDKKLYVCNDGGIYRTDTVVIGSWNDIIGQNDYSWSTVWEDLNHGRQTTSFYRLGLSRSQPGNVIAGAQDNSTFYKNGENWLFTFGGDGMEGIIDPTDPDLIYGSSQFGRIVRSSDGGKSIENTISDTLGRGAWTTPYFLHPNDPEIIFAATQGVWKSLDRGDNWVQLFKFPSAQNSSFISPASFFEMAPSDEKVMYAAQRIYHQFGQPSVLWRTLDGGDRWENISQGSILPEDLYFNDIAIDDDDPLHAWMSVGGFEIGQKIFETFDGGDTWENISEGLPNLPANCLLHQAGSYHNVLYAGLDIGVWYKTDTSDWQIYSQNLPNVIVSELEIQPTEQKLYASTFGRGIWVADLVTDNPPVSIETYELENMQVRLFPNPNRGVFHLNIQAAPISDIKLEIINVMGKKVLSDEINATEGSYQGAHLLTEPAGLYYLRLHIGKKWHVSPFVIE